MRRPLFGLAAGVLALAACGSGTTPAGAAFDAVLSAEELGSMLVTADELGTEWTEEERFVGGRPSEPPSAEMSSFCDGGPTAVTFFEVVWTAPAMVWLRRPADPENQSVNVSMALWSGADAAQRYQEGLRAADDCMGEGTKDGHRFVVSSLEVPAVGTSASA